MELVAGVLLEPNDPGRSDGPLHPVSITPPEHNGPVHRLVSFRDPDGAYLAAAALRQYLDATVVSDAIIMPTDRGPALQIPASAAASPVLRGIVRRFGGRIGPIEE